MASLSTHSLNLSDHTNHEENHHYILLPGTGGTDLLPKEGLSAAEQRTWDVNHEL